MVTKWSGLNFKRKKNLIPFLNAIKEIREAIKGRKLIVVVKKKNILEKYKNKLERHSNKKKCSVSASIKSIEICEDIISIYFIKQFISTQEKKKTTKNEH